MSDTKCLIFERDVNGHCLHYVRQLADALLEIGCDLSIALPADAQARDEYKVHLQPIEQHFELQARLDPRQARGYLHASRRVNELLEVTALTDADWAYIPYADVITQAAAVRGLLRGYADLRRVPVEGLVMRGRYAYPAETLKARVGGYASRWLMEHSPWHVTHLLDVWVYDLIHDSATMSEFKVIPEPVEEMPRISREEARRMLKIPVDGRYVATIGGIDTRKGIELLLAAFARARLRQDDRLLLVGRMSSAMRELIERDYANLVRDGRIVAVDRYVSDHELGCGFVASDILAVPHPRQTGSSGTLVRAVAAQRPVLASDFGWMARMTNLFELGATTDVVDVDKFAADIESLLDGSADYRHGEKAERFRRYNTVQNQQAHWVAAIGRSRNLALGKLATRIDWQWVLDGVRRA